MQGHIYMPSYRPVLKFAAYGLLYSLLIGIVEIVSIMIHVQNMSWPNYTVTYRKCGRTRPLQYMAQ